MKVPKLSKDNGEDISADEWNRAIKCLLQEIPSNVFKDIWQKCFKDKTVDLSSAHHTFGMDVRNLLRKNDFRWGAISLDQNWKAALEDAIFEFAKKNKLK